LLAFGLCFIEGAYSQGPPFSSNSTGSDGALNLTTPGTIYFDPKSFTPPLNPAGDNIFNFTTINIAAGVTLKLSNKILTGPVFWLASGTVTINGTIDLSGEDGMPAPDASSRVPAEGGAGGYGGGIGGTVVSGMPNLPLAEPGNGPGGGGAAPATANFEGGAATFTASEFLIPLIGGSGGGGANVGSATSFGYGGGGGGGAILIASSVSITVNGSILANGGSGTPRSQGCSALPSPCSGVGAGGAIRLVSNAIHGSGALQVASGSNGFYQNFSVPGPSPGRIRLEALTNTFLNGDGGSATPVVSTSSPFSLALPASAPGSLKVTSIGGIPINANPFGFPDATISSSSAVIVNIQAQFIPPGTVPTLTVFSEAGPDQVITCAPLQGTLQQSTSTASVPFPPGGSRGFVKATWTH
jgi:hypothetical protein